MKSHFTVIITVLIVFMLAGIIAVLVTSYQQKKNTKKLPKPDTAQVSVVIVERGRNRSALQVDAIHTYMPWIQHILIVNCIPHSKVDPLDREVTEWLDNSEPLLQKTEAITIEGVDYTTSIYADLCDLVRNLPLESTREHAIFLGDTTLPVSDITLDDLWSTYSSKRRMFNYTQPETTLDVYQHYESCVPVTLLNMTELKQAETLDQYILSESISGHLIIAQHINATLILVGNEFVDSQQMNRTTGKYELFCTYMISPSLSSDIQQLTNRKLVGSLEASSCK